MMIPQDPIKLSATERVGFVRFFGMSGHDWSNFLWEWVGPITLSAQDWLEFLLEKEELVKLSAGRR